MVILECPIENCDFQTADVEVVGAAAVLNIHAVTHTTPAVAAPAPSRGPKLIRPKIKLNATNEEWNAFIRRWETFRVGSQINDAIAPGQLLECTSEDLGDIVLRAIPDFTGKPLNEAIAHLKSIAVVPVALGVLRSELTSMQQDADETFRTFAARVQGKAETCEFKTKFSGICTADGCRTPYEGETYYTDEMIRDVLLHGIADIDIRREALSVDGIQQRSVNQIIAFIETRETARNANPSHGMSALSGYRHQQKTTNKKRASSPSAAEKARTASCPECGSTFHVYTNKSWGWNTKPHERCASCWKRTREKRVTQSGLNSAISAYNQFGQLSAIDSSSGTPCTYHNSSVTHREPSMPHTDRAPRMNPPRQRKRGPRRKSMPTVAILTHHIFTKGAWRRARLAKHPQVKLLISPERMSTKQSTINAIADSGAQSDVWSLKEYLAAGYSRADLSPVSMSLNAANTSPIHVDGAFFAELCGIAADGSNITAKTMTYVSKDVQGFYLSKSTMMELGMLSPSFPTPGCALPPSQAGISDNNAITSQSIDPPVDKDNLCTVHDGCIEPQILGADHDHTCSCPRRESVPPRPSKLPFLCVPENNEKMKKWLLDRYSASTFNACPHNILPCMTGPPLEIHINGDAKPYVRHKAIPVPVHWEKQVYDDLMRDLELDVIERVPYGEPVTWCHRMVLTSKHDGSPRRTVDLSPLNKHCIRETHSMESPFHVARRVPSNTWKTVTDAWNGYHSIPLRESDRHLTTFITHKYGRFRYKRAVQGYTSSGDGFNRRFDAILADFGRKERLLDDTVHYDTDLEAHWWRTIDLLTTVGAAGIVLNAEKFQFAQRTVDFAGCRITEDRIDPLPKYFNAISDFPTPTSMKDIQAWFGLVNQVSNYAQLRDIMAPFRPFLSPKTPFYWNSDLEIAFVAAKESIIAAIKQGVEIFDPHLRTCLRTDWSKKGVGYFLLQKHCSCESGLPDCCTEGWRITLVGSRFLQPHEERYAPVEGEALAVAWALDQTRFFTQGCNDLIVVTDHKPLVKILGDRTLDEITNTRLFRLKQRTLPWRFTIAHLPGKTNSAADAVSRYPSPAGEINLLETEDHIELAIMASIKSHTNFDFSISWEKLASGTQQDSSLKLLLDYIQRGFPSECPDEIGIKPYWRYKEALYELDGVVMYEDRAIIPPALRHQVLETFHAAHQGVSSMESRARTLVFWPGMTHDFDNTRSTCRDCITNAPSQPKLPPAPYDSPPSTPFEKIVADFFQCVGHHYLVVGDRLSGWADIFKCTPGSPQSGAEGLIGCLRNCFALFGVPTELSCDGGPEFEATATKNFLERWGVAHRTSSAYLAQSNGRAEVAVKAAKRLLRSNVGADGSLNNDNFLRAMLQLRNSPDPDCNISPAQVIFGRPLRDAFAFANRLEKFANPNIRPLWRDAWEAKESALRHRYHRTCEALGEHARPLSALNVGDKCYVQNQTGNYPKRWDRSGTVVEVLGHDSYNVKIDGSGRITKRNRRFLRKFVPVSPIINNPKASPFRSSITAPTVSTTYDLPQDVHNDSIPMTVHMTEPLGTEVVETDTTPATQVSHYEDSVVQLPVTESVATSRPRRPARMPRYYEPETGKWVEC